MIQYSHRRLRQAMDGLTYLLDSTSVPLNALSSGWARFSAEVFGAKLHVVLRSPCRLPGLHRLQSRQRQ